MDHELRKWDARGVKLKPGDTIGILGGGQLGRMLAMAAARLGLRCQVFSPDPDSPAFDVVLNATCAEYADVEALELFANDVDVAGKQLKRLDIGVFRAGGVGHDIERRRIRVGRENLAA